MSVDIPNPMGVNLDLIGPVELNPVKLEGIPDTFHIDVTHLPKIQIGLDKIELGLPKIEIGLDPLTLSVAITEIPRVRAHLPAHFTLGMSVLGVELLCFKLCGEAQLITEPYVPNRAEVCGASLTPRPPPTVVGVPPTSVAGGSSG
jgi:hypothetical protein